jgi:hypothetical protein
MATVPAQPVSVTNPTAKTNDLTYIVAVLHQSILYRRNDRHMTCIRQAKRQLRLREAAWRLED